MLLHDVRSVSVEIARSEFRDEAETYRADVEPRVGFGPAAILVGDEQRYREVRRMVQLLELEGALVTFSEAEAKGWIWLSADQRLPYRGSGFGS